jgi:hypothetical protein
MYLPACRISQTGVYGAGSRRQARINALFHRGLEVFPGRKLLSFIPFAVID